MASVTRRMRKVIENRFRKLNLTRMDDYVLCVMKEDTFGQGDKTKNEKRNWRGELSLFWIQQNIHRFLTQVREYQRLKVKDLVWKRIIVQDVLIGGIRVAEVIVRVVETKNDEGETVFIYQVIDGQQRISAFISYMNDEYTINVDGKLLKYSQLQTEASSLFHKFNQLTFGAQFYENISNEEASIIFKKVNDSTAISTQEDRNAIFGTYSVYIRDRVYYGGSVALHRLFEITMKPNGNFGEAPVLLNFPKLDIKKQRMEQHAWYSELLCWDSKGLRSVINETIHTAWVEEHDPHEPYGGIARAEKLLKITNFLMLASTNDQKENEITPMILSFMTLWYDELTNPQSLGLSGTWKVVYDQYVNGFLNVITDYSYSDDIDEKRSREGKRCRYMGPKGKPWKLVGDEESHMKEFKKLFGGKNLKAINTILQVLEYELRLNPEQFGAIELDSKRDFSREDTYRKLKEQGMKDVDTGLPLEYKNAVGAHIIPHSDGVKAGGVTQWHNLKVISRSKNSHEGNKTNPPMDRPEARCVIPLLKAA